MALPFAGGGNSALMLLQAHGVDLRQLVVEPLVEHPSDEVGNPSTLRACPFGDIFRFGRADEGLACTGEGHTTLVCVFGVPVLVEKGIVCCRPLVSLEKAVDDVPNDLLRLQGPGDVSSGLAHTRVEDGVA